MSALWSSANTGFTSQSTIVSLNEADVYYVAVKNEKGCIARDTFELSIEKNFLKADFLVVDTAYVDETVTVIEISNPLPDSLQWEVFGAEEILSDDPYYKYLRYDTAGN